VLEMTLAGLVAYLSNKYEYLIVAYSPTSTHSGLSCIVSGVYPLLTPYLFSPSPTMGEGRSVKATLPLSDNQVPERRRIDLSLPRVRL
jgi:hypothetical protein